MRKWFPVALMLAGMVLATVLPAAAATVSYSVGGWGPNRFPGPITPPANAQWGVDGYPGDALELQPYTGSLDLTPGIYVLKINTLQWAIDFTYGGTATDPLAWSDVQFAIPMPRSMSVDASSGTLGQNASLVCTWENDFLSVPAGSVTGFVVTVGGTSYSVHVTPLAIGSVGGVFPRPSQLPTQAPQEITCAFPCAQPPLDVMAEFVVDVPVPARTASWGSLKMIYR
jgi:hypothetical protein